MNFIKIFIASSIVEFESERKELGDYVRSLNDLYVKKGIYIELTLCEDFTNALAASRKQEEYNDSIRNSDYFYVLMGRKAGEYTIEEFNVALEHFQKDGTPRIYTYFVQLPENETPSQSISDFMNRLGNELHHYYTMFTNIDSVKLNMLLELSRNPAVNTQVKFEDGNATIDDRKVLSLEGIPVYAKNEALQKLIEKKKEYDQEFAAAVGEAAKDPGNTELTMNLLKLSEERTHILDQIHAIENSILQLTQEIEEKRSLNKELNWREKKAMEYTDQGNCDAAIMILKDAAWDKEIEQAESLIENQKKKIREYISGKRTLISNLRTKGVNEQTEQEICEIYEKLCELAEKHNVDGNIIAEYVFFLDTQNIKDKVEEYAKKAIRLSEIKDSGIGLGNIMKMYCYLGTANYGAMRFEEADKWYRKALDETEKLYCEDNRRWTMTLLETLSWRFWFLSETGRYQEAEEINNQEIEITRALCQEDKGRYIGDYYQKWGKHGELLIQLNRYDEALNVLNETLSFYENKKPQNKEAEYKNWIDIISLKSMLSHVYNDKHQYRKAVEMMLEPIEKTRELTKENPSRFMPFLSSMLQNQSILYRNINENEKAVDCGRESVRIIRLLREKYPQNYKDQLVARLEQLATALRYTSGNDEAEPLFAEAYQLLEEEYRKDPVHNADGMSVLCINYANNLKDLRKLEDAERIANQAVEANRKAEERNPGYYKHGLWVSLNCLGLILHDEKKYAEAEKIHLEALQYAKELKEQDHEANLYKVSFSSNNLALIYRDTKQSEKAEEMYKQTISVDEELRKKEEKDYSAALAKKYYNLGNIQQKLEKNEDAKESYRNCLEYYAKKENRTELDEADIRDATFWIGYLEEITNHPEEAEKMYAEAHRLYLKVYDEEKPGFLKAFRAKCTLYRMFLDKNKKYKEAYEICKEELKAFEALKKFNDGEVTKNEVSAQYVGGTLANRLGLKKEGYDHYRNVIRLIEENGITGFEVNRAYSYFMCGFYLYDQEQFRQAIDCDLKAHELFKEISETDTNYMQQVESTARQLVRLYEKEGNSEEAEKYREVQDKAHREYDETKYPVFYKQLKEFRGCTWGPAREMFTMEKPAPYPVLNSIHNNNVIGDERNFFRLAETDSHEKYGNLHKIEPGKTYDLYTFFCNAATPKLKEEGTLHNVRIQVQCPKHIEDHTLARVRGILTADYSNPDTVWCDSYIWSEEPVDFIYVKDSARLHGGKIGKEGILLSTDIFKKEGAPVGILTPDGEIPCTGDDYCGHVIVRVKAVKSKES